MEVHRSLKLILCYLFVFAVDVDSSTTDALQPSPGYLFLHQYSICHKMFCADTCQQIQNGFAWIQDQLHAWQEASFLLRHGLNSISNDNVLMFCSYF